jgi:hypothetical protein
MPWYEASPRTHDNGDGRRRSHNLDLRKTDSNTPEHHTTSAINSFVSLRQAPRQEGVTRAIICPECRRAKSYSTCWFSPSVDMHIGHPVYSQPYCAKRTVWWLWLSAKKMNCLWRMDYIDADVHGKTRARPGNRRGELKDL